MFPVTKMIQNRFGLTSSVQTRVTKNRRWKAELVFDVEEHGLEGLIRTGEFLTEEEAVSALNKKLLHIMGEK